VEHNFGEPKRTQIRELLMGLGYVWTHSVQWDDWYARPELLERKQQP
jgi:hypothetical protein